MYNDYRQLLKAIFEEKKSRNSQFSLRAFSKHLGMSSSALGLVISGRKNLSHDMAVNIAQRLKMTPLDEDRFCTMVLLELADSADARAKLQAKLNQMGPMPAFKPLDPAFIGQLPEWYHMAIPGLVYVLGDTYSAATVGKALGISEPEADAGIKRMLDLNMLHRDDKGRFYLEGKRGGFKLLEDPEAVIALVRNLLDKASQRLLEQNAEDVLTHAEILPFSENKMDRARGLTKDYMRQMILLSNEPEATPPTSIKLLQLNMVDLTVNDEAE